jgi:hypothetical protein
VQLTDCVLWHAWKPRRPSTPNYHRNGGTANDFHLPRFQLFVFRGAISAVSYSDVISDEHGHAEYVNLKEAWIEMNGQSRRKEEIWTSSSESQLTTAPCTAQWQRRPEAPMMMYRDWTPANSMQLASLAAVCRLEVSKYLFHSCRLRHGLLDTLLGCTQRRWLNAPSS